MVMEKCTVWSIKLPFNKRTSEEKWNLQCKAFKSFTWCQSICLRTSQLPQRQAFVSQTICMSQRALLSTSTRCTQPFVTHGSAHWSVHITTAASLPSRQPPVSSTVAQQAVKWIGVIIHICLYLYSSLNAENQLYNVSLGFSFSLRSFNS